MKCPVISMSAMTARAGRRSSRFYMTDFMMSTGRRRLGSREPALEGVVGLLVGFGELVGLLPEFLGSMVLQLSVVQLDN